ncbi:MAG TPA: hypothetical protein VNH14_14540 [Gemmatimonadales bacterium]|nr:hypothetical protein [Gemmatimonadales bacterium]
MATRDALEGLESRVDRHYAELKQLRGQVNAFERWRRVEAEPETETPGDDPENHHGPKAVQPTAFLSKRLRGF